MRAQISGPLLVAVVCLGLLAGCGGGNGDVGSAEGEDGAREVVQTLAAALPDGNGARVCSLLAPGAQRQLERAVSGSSCPAAVASAARSLRAADRKALGRDTEVELEVDGARAAARGDTAETLARLLGRDRLTLRRVEAHWVVS